MPSEIQNNLLTLLLEVDSICKKHDITYYLGGGTALGAVRNNGFLPWDDDVDIYITRENWLKLENVIDQELRADRAFASVLRDEFYCNPIPRYVDRTNTSIYMSQALAGIACGQHVEFLIMDPVPKDPVEEKNFRELLLIYTELLTPYFLVNRQTVTDSHDFNEKRYWHYHSLVQKNGKDAVLQEIAEQIFNTPDTDSASDDYCLRWGIKLHTYKRKYFGTPKYKEFEGHFLPVASQAESVFRAAYGDTWMMIPPHNEQVVHSALRSQKISYNNYLQDYFQFVDRDKAVFDYRTQKDLRMELLVEEEQVRVDTLKIRAVLYATQLQNKINSAGITLDYLVENGVTEESRELLSEYIEHQFSHGFMKWEVLIDAPVEVLAAAAEILTADGRYDRALKLLSMWQSKGVTAPQIDRIWKLLISIREVSIAIYDHQDFNLAKDLLEEKMQNYPGQVDFMRFKLITQFSLAASKSEYKEIRRKAAKFLHDSPEDWDVWGIFGLSSLQLQKTDDALAALQKVLQNSRNGILHKVINKNLQNKNLNISELQFSEDSNLFSYELPELDNSLISPEEGGMRAIPNDMDSGLINENDSVSPIGEEK